MKRTIAASLPVNYGAILRMRNNQSPPDLVGRG